MPSLAAEFSAGQKAAASGAAGKGGGTGGGTTPPASLSAPSNPWAGVTGPLPIDPSLTGWANAITGWSNGILTPTFPGSNPGFTPGDITPGESGWVPGGNGYAMLNQQGVQDVQNVVNWQAQHYNPNKGGFFGALANELATPLAGSLFALSFPLAIGGAAAWLGGLAGAGTAAAGATAAGSTGAGSTAADLAGTSAVATYGGLADSALGKILSAFQGAPAGPGAPPATWAPDPTDSLVSFADALGPTGFNPSMLSGQAATDFGTSGAAPAIAGDWFSGGATAGPAISPQATPQFYSAGTDTGQGAMGGGLNVSALPGWLQQYAPGAQGSQNVMWPPPSSGASE